jgi:hypothetical protein
MTIEPPNPAYVRLICGSSDHPSPAYPSMTTMIGSALGAAGRVISAIAHGESITVSAEEQSRRLEICHACDRYVPSADRCSVCGCRATWKARLKTEHCPLPEPKW